MERSTAQLCIAALHLGDDCVLGQTRDSQETGPVVSGRQAVSEAATWKASDMAVKVSREPAMAAGVIGAALALLVSYGVLNAERATLWGTLLTIVVPIAQAWVTRHFVMPVSKIHAAGLSTQMISHKAGVADGSRPRLE